MRQSSALLAVSCSLASRAWRSSCVAPCCSLANEFSRANEAAVAGVLWDGPSPSPSLAPSRVVELILAALQRNDEPQPASGVALLRRFATPEFCLAGEPRCADGMRVTPQELSRFFACSQYNLLLDPNVVVHFPSEICSFEDAQAWQEVNLETDDGQMLAKLGWSLQRDDDSCWRTYELSWHDFRDEFRPGIGQVEWDRSFG